MDFNLPILVSTVFIVLGFLGLHNLMHVSIDNAFGRSYLSGLAKLCRILLTRIGFLAYIIVGVVKLTWYMPFVYVALAIIIVTGFIRLMIVSKLIAIHFINTSSPLGQAIYAVLATFFLVRVIFFQF